MADFEKKEEFWTTDFSKPEEVLKALDKFREMTESTACPMAVQGYVGIAAMMVVSRLRGCCSVEQTMEATMYTLGVAIANIVGVLPEEEQRKSLKQLDEFIYKTVALRVGLQDPRVAGLSVQ